MNYRSHEPVAVRAGFTLIELLVVVAIIGILAGLTLAVSGSVRKSADRTKCLSNLRNVGAAIGSYAGDHEGRLPGPLWTFQGSSYTQTDSGTLGYQLAAYLGAVLDSQTRRMDVLVCPAWQRGSPYQANQSFLLNTAVLMNDTTTNPWGDAGTPSAQPVTMAMISGAALARTWAMQDLDAQSPATNIPSGVPALPVHGDKRNALFFDFHVDSVALDYKP